MRFVGILDHIVRFREAFEVNAALLLRFPCKDRHFCAPLHYSMDGAVTLFCAVCHAMCCAVACRWLRMQ